MRLGQGSPHAAGDTLTRVAWSPLICSGSPNCDPAARSTLWQHPPRTVPNQTSCFFFQCLWKHVHTVLQAPSYKAFECPSSVKSSQLSSLHLDEGSILYYIIITLYKSRECPRVIDSNHTFFQFYQINNICSGLKINSCDTTLIILNIVTGTFIGKNIKYQTKERVGRIDPLLSASLCGCLINSE